MRLHRTTTLRTLAGAAVAVLALAGCSDDSDSSSTSTSSKAASSGADSSATQGGSAQSGSGGGAALDAASAQALLLTAEEVGPGYTQVPQDQLQAALSQGAGIASALDAVQIDPPQCQAAYKALLGNTTSMLDKLDQVALGFYNAATGSGSASEWIGAESVVGSIDAVKAQAGSCSELTLNFQGMTAKGSMTPVDIDLGDDSVAVLATISMSAGGQSMTQSSGYAYVAEGENIVAVTLQTPSGEEVSPSELTELATKAYEKAKPGL